MEKEFVTYEQALALKELGFDEPCLASYETAFGRDIDFELGYIINGPKNYVLSPLKQQVFRWFREKYSLVGTIEAAYHTKKENHMFAYTIWEGRVENYGGCNWDVFEEAENACIDKLIELAKQQNNDTNPK
jgi:hypothetical protein